MSDLERAIQALQAEITEFEENPLRLRSDASNGIYLGLKRALQTVTNLLPVLDK